MKLVGRGDTTVVDAYLSPILCRYIDRVASELSGARLLFMQSHGGLADAHHFRGKDGILSGPAGGIVGMARTAARAGFERIITFDMGGTSTDVAHYAGEYERAFETLVAGYGCGRRCCTFTVAAGGGSICRFDGGRLRWDRNRPAPIRDRPATGARAADRDRLQSAAGSKDSTGVLSQDLRSPIRINPWIWTRSRVNSPRWPSRSKRKAARATPRRNWPGLPQDRRRKHGQRDQADLDPTRLRRDRIHLCAVSAAPAVSTPCAVADALGIPTIFIHPLAGVLSAYGMGLADPGC